MGTLKRLVSTLTILGGMVLVSTTANAGLVTFEYRGEVTAFSKRTVDTLPFSANVGDDVVATFELDTTVQDSADLDPAVGRYNDSVNYTLFIGSTRLDVFDADLVIENERDVTGGTFPNDRVWIFGGSTFFGSDLLDISFGLLIATLTPTAAPRPGPSGLVSSIEPLAALQSLDLQALDLSGSDLARGLSSRVDKDGPIFEIEFSIDSVSQPVVSVSEPSTWMLMLLGAGLGFIGLRMGPRHSGRPQHG